jgi:hypothetical protein
MLEKGADQANATIRARSMGRDIMNDTTVATGARPRFRLVPILVTALLGFALPYLAAFTAALGAQYFHPKASMSAPRKRFPSARCS